MIYTVVNDGYDVGVYRSLAKLVKFLVDESVYCVGEDGSVLKTAKAIRFEIETCNVARFYSTDISDGWSYRVQKHA